MLQSVYSILHIPFHGACPILHNYNSSMSQQSDEDIRDSTSLHYEVEEVDEDVKAEGNEYYPDLLYSNCLVL